MSVLLESLRSILTASPLPSTEADLETLVHASLDGARAYSTPDNRRAQWEFHLRNELLTLAVRNQTQFLNQRALTSARRPKAERWRIPRQSTTTS
jgi:hypothetical protein